MKKDKSKKKLLWGVFILIVIVSAAITAVSLTSAGISADTSTVDRGEVVKLIKDSGTVESASTIIITAKNNFDVKRVTASDGDQVKAGELLLESESKGTELDIKSLNAELAGLQVRYSQAMELSNKNKLLFEQGALSYEEYNRTLTTAKEIQAQITALNYSIQSYTESSGVTGIFAPIGGVITGVFVKEGEFIMTGSPVLEISNLNDVFVKADLVAEDANLVTVGDSVNVYNKNAGFSDDECTVRKINVKAKEKMSELGIIQKRVTLEIELGSSEVLRLGSDVDVEITVDKKDNVLRIPEKAVFEMENKDYVYIITDGKALLREIKIGLEGEDYIEILGGLSQDEEVILSPGNEIYDGVRIRKE